MNTKTTNRPSRSNSVSSTKKRRTFGNKPASGRPQSGRSGSSFRSGSKPSGNFGSGSSKPSASGSKPSGSNFRSASRPSGSSFRSYSRPSGSGFKSSSKPSGSNFRSGSRSGGSNFRSNSTRRPNSGGGQSGRGGRGGGRKMSTFDPSQFINKNPVEMKPEIYIPKNTFGSFGLDKRIVETVLSLGITSPSPIQDQIIPEILNGHDVIGLAETGTGKTAAFLLPLIEKTIKDMKRQTLILAPTRELAIQIEDELKKLSKGFRILSAACVGGVNIRPQIRNLNRQNNFIIGTPGRILDLINRNHFIPNKVTTVVLDEADRMLDMGFINDIKKIIGATPKERETLFFSATTSVETDKIVHTFLRNPVTISVKKKEVTNSIEQDVVPHGYHEKFETLVNLLSKPEFTRVLIFGAMKHSVKELANQLTAKGIKAESIHGNKNHNQRQFALTRFKNGSAKVLVATDVAARGIHVDNVSHVINYDLPNTLEDYIHRIGRTGRGDKRGKALTFISGRA